MSVINFSVPTDLQIVGNLTINSLNGLLKATVGLVSAATAGVDYVTPGALTSTGIQLGAYIGLVSGNLIQTGVQLGASINSLSGLVLTNLALTGFNLYAVLTGLSGQSVATYATIVNLASTGQQAWTAANNNGINLSGNLTQTGVQLAATAVATYATIINLANTGQQAWSAANNNGVNLSGNLTSTGASLLTVIASSGMQAWNAANNNGVNLSGNLTTTGQALYNDIIGLSGYVTNATQSNIVYTTGVQTITGLKTFGSGLFFGNIGAGSNPLVNGSAIYRLTVKGGNDNSIAVDNDGSQFTSINLYNNATVKASYFWDQTNTTFNMVTLPSTAALVFVTQASQERMRILGGGNVGIGTAAPQERLHVSGGNLRIDGSGNIAGTMTLGSGLILGTSNVTGGGLALGPDINIWRTAPNRLSTNAQLITTSGIYMGITGDYTTMSGAASVAQLYAISGQLTQYDIGSTIYLSQTFI